MASCYLKHWLSSFCFSNLSCCIYFKAITHWWATPLTRCYLSQWFHLSIDQNRPNTSQRLCIKVLSFAHSGFYCSQFYKQAVGELKDQDSQNSRVSNQQHGCSSWPCWKTYRTLSIFEPCKSVRRACVCASVDPPLMWMLVPGGFDMSWTICWRRERQTDGLFPLSRTIMWQMGNGAAYKHTARKQMCRRVTVWIETALTSAAVFFSLALVRAGVSHQLICFMMHIVDI